MITTEEMIRNSLTQRIDQYIDEVRRLNHSKNAERAAKEERAAFLTPLPYYGDSFSPGINQAKELKEYLLQTDITAPGKMDELLQFTQSVRSKKLQGYLFDTLKEFGINIDVNIDIPFSDMAQGDETSRKFSTMSTSM